MFSTQPDFRLNSLKTVCQKTRHVFQPLQTSCATKRSQMFTFHFPQLGAEEPLCAETVNCGDRRGITATARLSSPSVTPFSFPLGYVIMQLLSNVINKKQEAKSTRSSKVLRKLSPPSAFPHSLCFQTGGARAPGFCLNV